MSRYAEGTSVPMERSRQEVERTLVRYGASGFAYSWERREEAAPRASHRSWCTAVATPPSGRPCTCGAPKIIEREVVIVGFKMKTERGERQVQLEVPMPHESEIGQAILPRLSEAVNSGRLLPAAGETR